MAKVIDLVGQRFGRWVVLSIAGKSGAAVTWNCHCDCGNTGVIRGAELRRGHTQSCGCYNKDINSLVHKTHGLAHSTEYTSWVNMWQRCTNPNLERYPNYGGRGITVCERWVQFEHFYEDMGPKPEGHSIERINNDGDYEPSNCVWADKYTQAINKSVFKSNKVGCNGVKWDKDRRKWRAGITRRGKKFDLGLFTELGEAIAARKAAECLLDKRPLGENSNLVRQSA